jgi:hypothetical protein
MAVFVDLSGVVTHPVDHAVWSTPAPLGEVSTSGFAPICDATIAIVHQIAQDPVPPVPDPPAP